MEETVCLICGAQTRVPRGTPPLAHTCAEHTGQVPAAVGYLRATLAPDHLARAVERNAARLAIGLLQHHVQEFEERAADIERQMAGRRFDRTKGPELQGERSAYMACARSLGRVIRELELVTTEASPAS